MVAELRALRQSEGTGDRAGAMQQYARIGRQLDALRGWTDVLGAMAAADAGDTALVRLTLEESPDAELMREWGWRVHVRALQEAGDVRGAANVALSAGKTATSRAARAAALRIAGDLLNKGGDNAQALNAYRSAMQEAPESATALEAARAVAGWKTLDPQDSRTVAGILLRNGGVERAIQLFGHYLASGEGSERERAELRLQLGDALMRARRYAEAERHLDLASASLPRAEVLSGRVRYRQGRAGEAEQRFRSVADRAPGTAEAAEALYLLGDIAHDQGRTDRARELYRRSIATGAESEAALHALLRLVGSAVVAGDADGARRDISSYLQARQRPEFRAPALYWAGRAAELGGDRDAAREAFRQASTLDPVSYYGVRALERLGLGLRDVQLPEAPTADTGSIALVQVALFRVRVLQAIGLKDEAAFELSRLRAEVEPGSEALYLIAEAMQRSGQPIAAALLGREVARQRGGWDRRLLRIVYQFPFREQVEREARRNGLDPYMVAGLIRQESLFNPVAVSPAGAVGLMQVMPETGRSLARRVGIQSFSTAMLKDPDVNVRLGSLFLADQVRRYKTLTEVFAAYNAGPSRAAAWRSTFLEYADEDAFVERIPFAETRDYVKKLRLNRRIYELLYAGGGDAGTR